MIILLLKKTEVSIGIQSDSRLKPKLDCKYNIYFNKLPIFLKGLLDKDFCFSDTSNYVLLEADSYKDRA